MDIFTFANSEDLDEIPHDVVCNVLLRQTRFL